MDASPTSPLPWNPGDPGPRPLLVIKNEMSQMNQGAQVYPTNDRGQIKAIQNLFLSTTNNNQEIRHIDSERTIRETEFSESLAGLQARQTCNDERNQRRLGSLEDGASNVEINQTVMQRQHQRWQEEIGQRFRELAIRETEFSETLTGLQERQTSDDERNEGRFHSLEDGASSAAVERGSIQRQHTDLRDHTRRRFQAVAVQQGNTDRRFQEVAREHHQLEENMKQSSRELKTALESNMERALAEQGRLTSAIQCVQRDVRRFGPPGTTIEQLEDRLSQLMIGPDPSNPENHEQACPRSTSIRLDGVEQGQARNLTNMDVLYGYLQRLEERISVLDQHGQALQTESSHNREAIQSQGAINNQIAGCVTSIQGFDAILTNLQTLLKAQQAKIVAVENTGLSLHTGLNRSRETSNSQLGECAREIQHLHRTLVNVAATQDSHGGQLRTTQATVASLTQENSNTQTRVNGVMEGSIQTEMSRKLANIESRIGRFALQMARLEPRRRRLSPASPDRTDERSKRARTRSESPFLDGPQAGNRRCNGGPNREFCAELAMIGPGQSGRTRYTCTTHRVGIV